MKKFKNSLLFASLGLFFSDFSVAMTFSAPMKKFTLPIIVSTKQPPRINYVPPGEMSFTARRMCGDGDVAHFKQQYPNFDFIDSAAQELPVVVGYWVVPEPESSTDLILPTLDNWFPIAMKNINIATSQSTATPIGVFDSLKNVTSNVNVMRLVQGELTRLYEISKNNSIGVEKNFRVFAAALACKDPSPIKFEESNLPSPIDIYNSLKPIGSDSIHEQAGAKFTVASNEASKLQCNLIASNSSGNNSSGNNSSGNNSSGNNSSGNNSSGNNSSGNNSSGNNSSGNNSTCLAQINNFIEEVDHLKIIKRGAADPGYDFEFVENNQPESVKLNDDDTFNNFKHALKMEFPSASTLQEYKYYIQSQYSSIKNIFEANLADKIQLCNGFSIDSDKTDKIYPRFEVVPLNIACKQFSDGIEDIYNRLFNPGEKPSEEQFRAAKYDLAKKFLVATALKKAQEEYFDSPIKQKVQRIGCFKKSGQQYLIDRIVASYPLKFELNITATSRVYVMKRNDRNHLHPESLFAIQDYTNYFNHDVLAIWGQTTSGQGTSNPMGLKNKGFLLNFMDRPGLGGDLNSSSFDGEAINIDFKSRSVGGACNGTVYC